MIQDGVDMEPSFSSFLKAFTASWFTLMSGPLSVPLAISAFFVPGGVAKIILALTAVGCIVSASFVVWRRERQARFAEAASGKRISVKNAIGAAMKEAEQLYREMADRQRVEAWGTRINNVIVAAFGEGESTLFLNDAGLTVFSDQTPQHVRWLERRIRRLNELLARADTISIRTDYTPTNFISHAETDGATHALSPHRRAGRFDLADFADHKTSHGEIREDRR